MDGMAKQKEAADKAGAFDPTIFNISNATELPAYMSAYSDSIMGGNSRINAQVEKDASGANYIHISGKIVKKANLAFASMGISLSKEQRAPATDISDYSAIEFDARGNGEEYNLLYISDLVKDYNFHAAQFRPAKDWQTIRIPVSDIKQSTKFGKQIPLDLKTIRVISFCAAGKDYPIDLDLKNIHLVK